MGNCRFHYIPGGRINGIEATNIDLLFIFKRRCIYLPYYYNIIFIKIGFFS